MGHKGVILAVDDTPSSLKLLTELLKEEGYDVHSAINGELALYSALNNPPDLVLLDIRMSGMDGFEVCRRLQAQGETRKIPVIFVSAMSATEEKVQGFELGAVDFITKPYQKDELLARVRTHLELISLRHHLEESVAERTLSLAESEDKLGAITMAAKDAIILMDCDGKVVFWNAAAETMFGHPASAVIGRELHTLLVPGRFYQAYRHGLEQFAMSGTGEIIGKTLELAALRRDGEEFPVELSVSATELRGKWHAIGILRDITERKQAEDSLRQLNRALKTLSEGNRALLYAREEMELMRNMCRVATTNGGYLLAWAGYVLHDERKSIEPVAMSGAGSDYVDKLDLTWADEPRGQGPTGNAVRSGQTQVAQDIALDARMEPWRDAALKLGYAASVALPLRHDGEVFGVMSLYAAERNAFGVEELKLLEEMAADLSYGVINLRTRKELDQAIEERQQHQNQLRASLEDSIDAIAATVEMRDPYTAGHQRRVADLAAAMARELGMAAEQVHGIRLAGAVHDLGKIRIPAEILSKPGKLSAVEFGLIKTHPQAGNDILKGIEFPWPIAQMVLQHHERLDGSGYPQGLKGDDILLEARILAVADVVEAITSHRPYRPGLGLQTALSEITDKRGILYDAAVVDSCIRLFRQKNYTLAEFTPTPPG